MVDPLRRTLLKTGAGRQAMLTRRWRDLFVAVILLTSTASSASAQDYSFDARRIALGGAGGTPNVAPKLVERQRPRTNLTTQLELPVTYTGDLSYHRDAWSAYTEYSSGLGGTNFRAGLEYRLGGIELRGAGRYSQGSWYPAAGAGFNPTRSLGVDAAFYGTRTFLEPHPHVGLAISLRFDRR